MTWGIFTTLKPSILLDYLESDTSPMQNASITIIVGSQNPVKINAAKHAIQQIFNLSTVECRGVSAPSGVAEQPMDSAETRLGAINRVNYCKAHYTADYYVAIEGGVDQFADGPATFAYVVIADNTRMSVGRSAMLPLPLSVYQALLAGEELGPVMDRLFNTQNIKQKGGAIGLLTGGIATRQSNYTQALILALAPFLHQALYSE
jgi:inosine/xanthosine triphosphatase